MYDVVAGAHTVSKRFGATTALDSVDFEVRASEVHALVGENGAGKSTLVRILGGAVRPGAILPHAAAACCCHRAISQSSRMCATR